MRLTVATTLLLSAASVSAFSPRLSQNRPIVVARGPPSPTSKTSLKSTAAETETDTANGAGTGTLSTFLEDPRDIFDKTAELFKKYDCDKSGDLHFAEAKDLFAEALGVDKITLDDFSAAHRAIDKDIIPNVKDERIDLYDAVGWLRVFQKSEEVQKTLKESGAAAALMKSAEVVTASEKGRLQKVIKAMSPYKDLLCMKFSDKLGEDPFDESVCHDPEFESAFTPLQLRTLALVSHNNMKGTMRKFVESNKNLLKKFRLTGTNSTMTMLREVFGDDPKVVYGPSCKSGPLGGDAELVAALCNDELGGMLFFQDPMESHMHRVDIDCLNRQALIYNVMTAVNPTSALMMANTLRTALKDGKPELIPSFIFTLECPTVEMYAQQQKAVIQANIDA